MGRTSMVMFDLIGTTIHDDMGVMDCLYKAAQEFNLKTTPEEILSNMGTNKIHLYQFLIARERGKKIDIKDFERIKDRETYELAKKVFDRYHEIMVEHYKREVKEISGTSGTFRWCQEHGIKVATNTGFHRAVNEIIMERLGWIRDGLVDICVDVEHIPGQIGRPAPFMIFYAMTQLDVQCVHEVIKVGNTAADMLEGYNAGCRGVVGVLTGNHPITLWGKYWHTHVIPSVADLPDLIESEFL